MGLRFWEGQSPPSPDWRADEGPKVIQHLRATERDLAEPGVSDPGPVFGLPLPRALPENPRPVSRPLRSSAPRSLGPRALRLSPRPLSPRASALSSRARPLSPATRQTSAGPGAWAPPPQPLSPPGPGHHHPHQPWPRRRHPPKVRRCLKVFSDGMAREAGPRGGGSRLVQEAAATDPTVATATSLVSPQPAAASSDRRTAPGGGAEGGPTPPP